jgi:predicted DNA-binding transcriptional regulator AlpA
MTKILKKKDVAKSLGVSCPTIDRWSEETRQGLNDFPLSFTQRGQRQLWTASAIEEWIARRQAAQSPVNVPPARQSKAEAKKRQERTVAGLQRHGLNRNSNKEV